MNNIRILDANTIEVETDIAQHQYQIRTGYYGQEIELAKPDPMAEASPSFVAKTKRTAEQNFKSAETIMLSGGAGCPCCASSA